MAIQRVPVQTVADPVHGQVDLEGNANDALPNDRVYVDAQSGRIADGRLDGKLSDLKGGELEIPRTVWY